MRYWGILVAKLAVAAAVLFAIWLGLNAWYQPPEHIVRWGQSPFLHDLKWTSIVFLFNLVAQGTLFLIIWDQKKRCRTCGRRLRMPVSHGRYGQMLLFGRPRTDYICVYGHGTLQVPELHIGPKEPSDWKFHDDDMWKELYSLDQADREKQD